MLHCTIEIHLTIYRTQYYSTKLHEINLYKKCYTEIYFRDIHKDLYDAQMAGLKADFLQPPFGFKVFQPTNGGSSNTGV